MPSITPMLAWMASVLLLIFSMVETTLATTSPPCWAERLAKPDSWAACVALSAYRLAIAAICSTLVVVFSSEADCNSVRCDKSRLPMEISREALATCLELLAISRMVSASLPCMSRSEYSKLSVSLGSRRICMERSPWAMRLAIDLA